MTPRQKTEEELDEEEDLDEWNECPVCGTEGVWEGVGLEPCHPFRGDVRFLDDQGGCLVGAILDPLAKHGLKELKDALCSEKPTAPSGYTTEELFDKLAEVHKKAEEKKDHAWDAAGFSFESNGTYFEDLLVEVMNEGWCDTHQHGHYVNENERGYGPIVVHNARVVIEYGPRVFEWRGDVGLKRLGRFAKLARGMTRVCVYSEPRGRDDRGRLLYMLLGFDIKGE